MMCRTSGTTGSRNKLINKISGVRLHTAFFLSITHFGQYFMNSFKTFRSFRQKELDFFG